MMIFGFEKKVSYVKHKRIAGGDALCSTKAPLRSVVINKATPTSLCPQCFPVREVHAKFKEDGL